jgi:DNA-binding transcriptional LysR family regulator
MPINFGDLRWAVITAQQRSLRQAAAILNIRQSTLSRRIRDLESDLGATLFERTNGGTRTTSEGREFLAAAQRIIEEAETITHRLRSRARGDSGRLTIGVHASLSAGNLRASLIDYHRQFPEVEIGLVDGSSDHLISDLDASIIDVAFVAEVNTRWEGTSFPVWGERVVLAVPEDHPLNHHDNIRWHDLEREPILIPQRGPGLELLKLVTAKVGGAGPQIRMHDVSLDRLLTLVGMGLGILPAGLSRC